jgi:multiple sugar transport system permease protein
MKTFKNFFLTLYSNIINFFKNIKKNKKKIKKVLLGGANNQGIIIKIILYFLLIVISFVYLYPLIFIISGSFKDLNDSLNPNVHFVPTKLYFDNYVLAFEKMAYIKVLFTSLLYTLVPAITQTICASIVGYGFAKFKFPLKKLFLALAIGTYILIPQVTLLPKLIFFLDIKIVGSPLALILPATTGQGINSAIFILIFYQFYKMVPVQLEEAAYVDGASFLKTFITIDIPLVSPAFLTSILFSFVWYWNETYVSVFLLGQNTAKDKTLQLRFMDFSSLFSAVESSWQMREFEGVRLAAMLICIIPLIIVYVILQRRFIEAIDQAGITGE